MPQPGSSAEIDVVITSNDVLRIRHNGSGAWLAYQCEASHTARANTEPGTGADEADVWTAELADDATLDAWALTTVYTQRTVIGTVTITKDQFKLSSVFNIAGRAALDALKNATLLTDAGTIPQCTGAAASGLWA